RARGAAEWARPAPAQGRGGAPGRSTAGQCGRGSWPAPQSSTRASPGLPDEGSSAPRRWCGDRCTRAHSAAQHPDCGKGETVLRPLDMPMDLSVDFHFCAAHRLPYYDGPCFRMHGHNYKLQVTVSGKPNARDGMIIDFEEIRKKTWELALNQCDHH